MELHWTGSLSDLAGLIGGKSGGLEVRRTVEIDEGVADGVVKGMVNGAEANVVHAAVVELHGIIR